MILLLSQGEFARRDVTILLMPRFGVETDLAVHNVNSYGPKFALAIISRRDEPRLRPSPTKCTGFRI